MKPIAEGICEAHINEYLRDAQGAISAALALAGDAAISIYYRIWVDKCSNLGLISIEDACQRIAGNPSILKYLDEILSWAQTEADINGLIPELPFACPVELHAQC